MNSQYNEVTESFPKKRGPWTTLSSLKIYENPWISVREDQVLRPDGKPGIYGLVQTKVATGVVALTENLEIVLVGQYRYATEVYTWEIVEGGAEHGEDPLQAIQRELVEEAGMISDNWELLAKDIQLSNCHSSELANLYLAKKIRVTAHSPDPAEPMEVKMVPFKEALDMVYDGKIVDAMSIIGIQFAANKLGLTR